jgi:hypothetical protein
MTPQPAGFAMLTVDVEHFSLQGQSERDVGDVIDVPTRRKNA